MFSEEDCAQIVKVLAESIKNKKTIYYHELSNKINGKYSAEEVSKPLGYISEVCKKNDLPMISVIVINTRDGYPGPGFYELYKKLYDKTDKIKKDDRDPIFIDELNKVFNCNKWSVLIDYFQIDNQILQLASEDLEAINFENGEDSLSIEGKRIKSYASKYERDPRLRAKAIKIHGLKCVICSFDFEKMYGNYGKGFIEIHHLKPLFQNNGVEILINPATDLVPVCSNCHRIIHRKKENYLTVKQIKEMISLTTAST